MDNHDVNTERTGGTRYSSGKPGIWWAVPVWGLRLVARVTEKGSAKYSPRDYLEGQSFSTLIDCAMRHTLTVLRYGPWAVDADTGCYHAALAAWNWLCLLGWMEENRTDLDDVTPWFGVTAAKRKENGWEYPSNPPSFRERYGKNLPE